MVEKDGGLVVVKGRVNVNGNDHIAGDRRT